MQSLRNALWSLFAAIQYFVQPFLRRTSKLYLQNYAKFSTRLLKRFTHQHLFASVFQIIPHKNLTKSVLKFSPQILTITTPLIFTIFHNPPLTKNPVSPLDLKNNQLLRRERENVHSRTKTSKHKNTNRLQVNFF